MTDVPSANPSAMELGPGDLDAVTQLHLDAFAQSELSRLGPKAVRAYYAGLMEGPHHLVALGVRQDGELVGFLFGGVFRGATIGFLEQNRAVLLVSLICHPGLLARSSGRSAVRSAVGLLSRRFRGIEPERPAEIPPGSFGVLSVAVSPALQRCGIGTALIVEAEHRAATTGFTNLHLTVDPDDPGALAFYQRAGWTPLRPRSHRGRGQLWGKPVEAGNQSPPATESPEQRHAPPTLPGDGGG